MSSIANLPILSLVSSSSLASSGERPVERDIDRNILVAISPDREELFMSKKSIDEIRQILKLRTGPTERHWLYQTKRRANVDFRDATARTSTLIHRDENKPGDVSAIRRVLSTASLGRNLMPLSRIENNIPWGREGSGVTVWGSLVLSTDSKLVSPRPLGPTHILVIHTEPLSVSKSGKSTLPRRGRGDATKPAFPNMDVAINDVLFVMGAPNLVTPDGHCSLPHRLHKELPRVLLRVPFMETFPELIVDHMYPLPVPAPAAKDKDTASIFSPKKSRGPASLLGLLAPYKLTSSASSTYSVDTVSSGMSGHSTDVPATLERTADTVARDIVDSLPFFSDEDPQDDELVSTISTLNALKANLEFLGYFGKSVWDELEMSINILTRALVHRAAVAN
ncbi:hypothetical protein MSAN_00939800 [Mycena sanguinolenta]|uniref:Uncharacterized protein n=1 Tax=Mycena sanguinolenta TaxID=230812 RepID=A0A8H6YZV9_9AGAR|nr:hypothetical protein MSAN_00939800 [Mycena sanguinolenta]